MGLPRTSRRRVVLSDDEDENDQSQPSNDLEIYDIEHVAEPTSSRLRSGVKKPSASAQATKTAKKTAVPAKAGAKKSSPKSKASKPSSQPPAAKSSNAKPIYSFFNAATQRRLSSQPSASPEKRLSQEVEAIHDSSDDDGSVTHAADSKTALALRKRKDIQNESIEPEPAAATSSARQKFRKANDGSRTPSFAVTNDDKRPWTEQFAPVDLTELAVHSRKVQDVRRWLDTAFQGKHARVLALRGAAGTAKTTTIRLLAKDMGFEILEWKNPVGNDLAAEGSASTSAQFEDFMGRATRANSLAFSNDAPRPVDDDKDQPQQLLLVEEFPSTFSTSSNALQSFRSALLQYMAAPSLRSGSVTPVVLVISETLLSTNTAAADSFTAHRLLGPVLTANPYFTAIDFNPIAPGILTKALESIIVKEARKSGRRKAPGPQVLKHLVDTGDIRSAVSSLEFLCLRGDEESWSSKVTFTKTKKSKAETPLTKAEEDALKLVSNRETSLGIFHAVGRVLYNNRILPASSIDVPQPPSWLPQHHRQKVSERDVNSLIDELGTDTPTFMAALHENYLPSCASQKQDTVLDVMSNCMDNLSDADLLSVDRFSYGTRAFSGTAPDSIRQDEMAFQVAARGLLFSLPHPVHRKALLEGRRGDAFRMYYPVSLRMWKKREEIEGAMELLTSRLSNTSTMAPVQPFGTRGVGSWKRPSNDESSASDIYVPRLSRKEMLMEQLPYVAQIQAASSAQSQSSIAQQLATVTQISGRSPIGEDNEVTNEEDSGDTAQEQWTTDKPEMDAASVKKPAVGLVKRKPKTETEGGGLAFPVERDVEKLVLEDDDISDDG